MATKNRKLLAILGSAAVLVVAAALVVVLTGGTADKPAPDVTDDGSTVLIGNITDNPNTETPDTAPDTTPGTGEIEVPDIEGNSDATPSTEVPDADPVLDIDADEEVNVNISEFEENTEPPAPPVVSDESALTDPDAKPTYEENQTNINPGNDAPQNGDKKEGKIYIEGFCWIVDEGGGSYGEVIDSDGDINKQVGNMG